MSLVLAAFGFVFGIVATLGGLFVGAPAFEGVAKILIKLGIRSGDAWVIDQRGNKYELLEVEYDEDTSAYVHGDGEGRRVFEDPDGLMHSLWKTPFGFSFDGTTAITDSVTAAAAKSYGDLKADGGALSADTSLSVKELQERAHVGTLEKTYDGLKHRVEFVNPFAELPPSGTLVDARQIQSMLSRAGSSEVPQKTAENAAQAERAFEDWGELKRNASLIAAFMVGALVMYFGMSGGGGGGGVGISLMLGSLPL